MSTEQAAGQSQQAHEPTPQSGGSWVRLPDGSLVPADQPAQEAPQAPQAQKPRHKSKE